MRNNKFYLVYPRYTYTTKGLKHIINLVKKFDNFDIVIDNFWEAEFPFYEVFLQNNSAYLEKLVKRNINVIHCCSRFPDSKKYNHYHPLNTPYIEKYINSDPNTHRAEKPIHKFANHTEILDPAWFLRRILGNTCRKDDRLINNLQAINNNVNRINKLYINLNGSPRDNRIDMILALHKNNLMKDGYNSWYGPFYMKYRNSTRLQRIPKHHRINPKKNFDWQEDFLILDSQGEHGMMINDVNHLPPLELADALIHVVGETHTNYFFLTEKTAIPILYGKPFMVSGCRYFHQILKKEFGFVLYDEIIDYSFDSEDTSEKRTEGIIKNLNNLKNQDYRYLYNLIKDKLEYNSHCLIELTTSPLFSGLNQFLDIIRHKYCMNDNLNPKKEYDDDGYLGVPLTAQQTSWYKSTFPLKL